MQEVNINTLVNNDNELNENIPDNIIIVGKIDRLYIVWIYNQLDLSKVNCDGIIYLYQEGDSIKNHILSDSLRYLDCSYNKLILLPDLPNSLERLDCDNNRLKLLPNLPISLEYLDCSDNQLNSFPELPNSLKNLYCSNNQLISLLDLPNSLEKIYCSNNKLTSLPDLPNSLKKLYCDNNQLKSLPDFSHINHELELSLIQDEPINYIPYTMNIKLYKYQPNKINIEGYPHNPIKNQNELDQYMDYIKNYQLNRIKSARK